MSFSRSEILDLTSFLFEILKYSWFIDLISSMLLKKVLVSENNHAFNLDAFSKMKENVIFINCARGPIVNESDLAHALNNNIIYRK